MIQLLMSKASFVRPAPSDDGVGGGLGRRVTSLHCTDQSPAGKTMSGLKLCHANGPNSSWRYHAGLLEVFIYLVSVTWIFFVNLSEFSVKIGEFIINWNWFVINLVSYDDDFCDFIACIFFIVKCSKGGVIQS